MRKTAIILLTAFATALLPACSSITDSTLSSVSDTSTVIINGENLELSLADTAGMDFEFTDRDRNTNDTNEKVLTPEEADGEYLITKEGSYLLSGDIDKTVHIKAGDTDKIQLVLENARISTADTPAIYIESADKVFITLGSDTENEIAVGGSMQDETLDGAIFSRADLTVNGNGLLKINAEYKHGIVSKDDLVIVDAALDITAQNVALNGKDCVKISGADLTISAGSDGIRSDNAEDATRGFVYIESGKINIVSGNDGIQAETVVKIKTADTDITAGGGSSGRTSNTSESFKGIKAVSDVIIHGGNYKIDSLDDAIHSNGTVLIEGGEFSLLSGDDGVHADGDLAFVSGDMTVKKSYEAMEGSRIIISGGTLDLTASDDGLNAAGGNDQSTENNPQTNQSGEKRPQGGFGMDMFDNGVGEIYISGGYTHINASGDGIDSNGSIEISGGVTLVSGPTNNGNGAFDYGSSATVSGGVLIATGSSGMAQGFSNAVDQGAMLVNVGSISAGTPIAICDENGKCIASFTPDKAYQTAVITAPEIQQGKKYAIYTGAEAENADKYGYASNTSCSGGTLVSEITMDTLIYGSGGGFGGGPGGDFGGGNKPGGNRGERPDAPPDGFGGGYQQPPQNNG